MSELLSCPFCAGEAHVYKNNLWHVACERAHNCCVTMSAFATEAEAIDAWNTRHVETCHYIPDVMHSYFDEDDNEIDTDEADPDGCYCSCDHCGYTMMTGELGWFDESPGEHGGIVYVPRFKHCPECGRKVER